jgi:predicted ArsR family transcriptional regulator
MSRPCRISDPAVDVFLALSWPVRVQALRVILSRPAGIDTEELAAQLGARLNRRWLRNHLDQLENVSLIEVCRHSRNGRGRRNVYRALPLAADLLARVAA